MHTTAPAICVEGLFRRVKSLLTSTLLELVEVRDCKGRNTLNQFICEIRYQIKTLRISSSVDKDVKM